MRVALAAINSPTNVVLAGPHEALKCGHAATRCAREPHRRLHTSHAFHSPMMEPMIGPLSERVAGVALHEPSTPYISSVTGDWIRPEEATRPHIGRGTRATPSDLPTGSRRSRRQARRSCWRSGPGVTLSTWRCRRRGAWSGRAFGSLPEAGDRSADEETMLVGAGETMGQRRRAGLGFGLWTGRVRACRCRPIRSSAAATGSMRRPGRLVRQRQRPCQLPRRSRRLRQKRPRLRRLAQGRLQAAHMDGIRETITEILQDVSGETVDPAATADVP